MISNKILYFRILLFFFSSFSSIFSVRGDGGMWNISLTTEQYQILKKRGLQLPLKNINSDEASLKDAIVSFGNGGTGTIISSDGLILTNYHLALRLVELHSTTKANYVTEGFWAKSRQEELPNEGLFIKMQLKEVDVTQEVLQNAALCKNYAERKTIINNNIQNIIKEMTPKQFGYSGEIKVLFGGYKYMYYLFQQYNDIRLVAAPPYSIAKFGDEDYNWAWPRFSGDFALFRIYANKNKPCKYSAQNTPYHPKKVIPFSTSSLSENDFVITIGFPRETSYYETSHFIENIVLKSNNERIPFMKEKLDIMGKYMKRNDSLHSKILSKYSSISNDTKKREGILYGLQVIDGIKKKKEMESQFLEKLQNNDSLYKQYASALDYIQKLTLLAEKYMCPYDCLRAGILNVDILNIACYILKNQVTNNKNWDEVKSKRFFRTLKGLYDNFDATMDKDLFVKLINMYIKEVPSEFQTSILKNRKNEIEKLCNQLYHYSCLVSYDKTKDIILKSPTDLLEDPIIKFTYSIDSLFNVNILPTLSTISQKLDSAKNEYVFASALLGLTSWPDANGTLRLSYGNISCYAKKYPTYYTTYNELVKVSNNICKENKIPKCFGLDLVEKSSSNTNTMINFITTCHTTGGNSGSPVLNKKGELVGLNFDRIKEGTAGDYIYESSICRNIAVDCNYILFILSKYANAQNILKELIIKD
nr:S46 family peptidase [uncultured Bacteroides sp.]